MKNKKIANSKLNLKKNKITKLDNFAKRKINGGSVIGEKYDTPNP